MKNNNDINNSLSEIKKVMTENKQKKSNTNKENDFFLLKDLVKKGSLGSDNIKRKDDENSKQVRSTQESLIKSNTTKKNKLKKTKLPYPKKNISKNASIDNVINKEIKPIIKHWINKNLRIFVKKIVLEEFKLISKTAFKQKSISK